MRMYMRKFAYAHARTFIFEYVGVHSKNICKKTIYLLLLQAEQKRPRGTLRKQEILIARRN